MRRPAPLFATRERPHAATKKNKIKIFLTSLSKKKNKTKPIYPERKIDTIDFLTATPKATNLQSNAYIFQDERFVIVTPEFYNELNLP